MTIIPFLVLGAITAILTWLLLFPLDRALKQRQAIDVPNDRSSHTHPTTRGGGLAIVILTLGGCLLISQMNGLRWSFLVFSCSAGMIALVSWIDDLHSLPNRLRFAVHSLGAILAIINFGAWDELTLPGKGAISLGWLGIIITFIWIVGLTNAYNFMDGIDGIAAGQAVVVGIGWTIFALKFNQPVVAALAVLLAGTSLGFLGHNWSPARMFMGDVSSAFLGYTFAVLPLMIKANTPIAQPWIVLAVLPVWSFVFDTGITIVRRWRNGENIFASHRSHLYQRLVISGWSHSVIATLYMLLATLGVGLAYVVLMYSVIGVVVTFATLAVCAASLWIFVAQQERKHPNKKVVSTYETTS